METPAREKNESEGVSEPEKETPSMVANKLETTQQDAVTMKRSESEERAHPAAWKAVARIVCFFCLVAALAFLWDGLIGAGLRRVKTSTFGVSNRIVRGDINAEVIISGSSRAVCHYDPRVIQAVTGRTVFNLGRNGSQTDMQLAVLKTYLKHNRKPDFVLHNLDAFSFVTTREAYDPGQYIPYLHEEDLYGALRQINPEIWWKSKHVPLYGYVVEDMRFNWLAGLKGLLGWFPSEDHFLGFNPRSKEWSDDFEHFKAMNPDGVRFEIEPHGVTVVEELVRVCKEHGVQLVFVYSPEYGEMQALTKNREEIFAVFRTISERYEVPFWDFSGWEHSLNRNFFQNSQHLNAKGAAAFSGDVGRRLLHASAANASTAPGRERVGQ